MNHRSACTVLLAAGLALSAITAATPSTASHTPAGGDTSASVASQPVQRDAEPSTVRSLAQLCIDPRHVALVSNALRHGRVITLAEARSWCDD
jgi:hypothetical protein